MLTEQLTESNSMTSTHTDRNSIMDADSMTHTSTDRMAKQRRTM